MKRNSSGVFVDGLHPMTSENKIAKIFSIYGPLEQIKISRRSPWIAYVNFEDEQDARKAIRCLNGTLINGNRVKVNLAKGDAEKRVKSTKVYVEGLDDRVDKVKIRDAFKSFGHVRQVWVAEQQPWSASVYFGDKREAIEAVRFLDGTLMNGRRITVKSAMRKPNKFNEESLNVFVSDLGEGADEREIEETFMAFGRLKHIWVARQRPGVACVFFENDRDAVEAINCLNGTLMNGRRVTVQLFSELHNMSAKESSEILVCGLRKRMDENDIEETFRTVVNVRQVRILEPGKACLSLDSHKDAVFATKLLNGRRLNGKEITVKQFGSISRKRMWNGTKVHVSGLCEDTDKREMEETFNAYGYVNHMWFAKQPPWVAYAFFDKERYAIEAVKDLDGTLLNGRRLRVKLVNVLTHPAEAGNNDNSSKVCISGLDEIVDENIIKEIFTTLGHVKQVWVSRQHPVIANVYFEKESDAKEALRYLDGTLMNGRYVKLELTKEKLTEEESTNVYVAGLGEGAEMREIKETFMKFGCLKHVWISRGQAGIANIFFERYEDAKMAVQYLNGTYMNGNRVEVGLTSDEREWWRWNNPLIYKKNSKRDFLNHQKLYKKNHKVTFARTSSSSSESWEISQNEKRKTDESDTILSLLTKINVMKHLVNLEERLIDEESMREHRSSDDEYFADRHKIRRTGDNSKSEKRRIFVGSPKASIIPVEDATSTTTSLPCALEPSPSKSMVTPSTRLSSMMIDENSAKCGLPGISLSSYQPFIVYNHQCYHCQNPHNHNPFYLSIGD